MKGIYLKLSVLAYTIFVLCHNLFEIALTLPTIYYYVFQTGFMLMTLFIDYEKLSLTDKLFINYFKILLWLSVVCSVGYIIYDSLSAYGLEFSVFSIILSIFGSLIALYKQIRRLKR